MSDPTCTVVGTLSGTPHDALFKQVFSDPRRAMAEARAVLPEAVAGHLDFEAAQLCPGSWVDEELAQSHSDLLFEVPLSGRPAYLYFLFEHQSEPDGLLPMRMLRYMLRIWERFLKDAPEKRRLPAILPLVLSHARQGWTAPTRMSELYDLDAAALASLVGHLPDYALVVDDLQAQDDERLYLRVMDALGRLSLMMLKHARGSADLAERLVAWRDLVDELLAAPSGVAAMAVLLRYAFKVNERVSPEELVKLLSRHPGDAFEEAVVTVSDRLVEQGRQQGRQEGVAAMLLKVLRLRFGTVSPEVERRVQEADAALLDQWVERVLAASRVEDVFTS